MGNKNFLYFDLSFQVPPKQFPTKLLPFLIDDEREPPPKVPNKPDISVGHVLKEFDLSVPEKEKISNTGLHLKNKFTIGILHTICIFWNMLGLKVKS